MGKRSSPIGYRLGVTLFWISPVVFQKSMYAFKNRINIICLQMLTNLFYREKIYFSKIGIQTFFSTNAVICIDYFLPLATFKKPLNSAFPVNKTLKRRTRKKQVPILVNSPSYIVRFASSIDIINCTYRISSYSWRSLVCRYRYLKLYKRWKKKKLEKLKISVVSKRKPRLIFILKKKKLSRFFRYQKHRKYRENYTFYSSSENVKRFRNYKDINARIQNFFVKFVELRLKNFLENLLTGLFLIGIKILFRNLVTIFQLRTMKRLTYIRNVFDLIRTQLLMNVLNRKDGHSIFWYLSGLIICGCYFTSSSLLLMWLTLKLSNLRKFDLHYTQTKLIALFFNVLKSVFFLLNTIMGVRLEIYGKLNGKMRASSRIFNVGRQIPKQSIFANIEYGSQEAYTYGGVLNCKLWLLKQTYFINQ